MSYPSKQVATLYNVSHETLRKWTKEFKQHLSHSANPGARKPRFYNIEDMQVISLIAEQKDMGLTFEEIHASLQSGQRGNPPELEPDELHQIIQSGENTGLAVQNTHLKHKLAEAQQALMRAEDRLELLQETQRAKAEAMGQIKALNSEIERLHQIVKDQQNQIGENYSKGFQEGWKMRVNTEKDE